MPKFHVRYEASAAILFDVEVEAEDENEAKHKAEELNLNFRLIADELVIPDPIAVAAYAEASGHPIAYASVEADDEGFDLVEVELAPENP